MPHSESAAALQQQQDGILKEVREQANRQLAHLDRRLWVRRGELTRCLYATFQAVTALVRNQSRTTAVESEPASADRLSHDPAIVLNWTEAPVGWTDLSDLLEMLRIAMVRALPAGGSDTPRCLIESAIYGLKSEIAGFRLAKLESDVARQRDESVTLQHLAGRFLANASHELRTPLTAILGFSELLMEGTYGDLSSGQRVVVGHIDNSAQNLLEIVNNVLDLMQIRAGRLELQYRPVALRPLLTGIYHILIPLAERRNVNFIDELPEELGSIEADEGIVRHIVYYLLQSALRATPQGGSVVLRARRTETTATIVTYDTALHFPPEVIENMKDAFPILENSPARGYEGWEIGFPLVKRYVDLHQGDLDIESNAGEGTTIQIHLPVNKPAGGPALKPRA